MFKSKSKKPTSVGKEWLNSLAFAVVAATLIRFFTMEAFAIPTPSMEANLMVGDFLFVSKLHYGARTPQTPLQLPLTHQKIWGTNLPSYSDAIQLPSYRLPGFTGVKNNDVVVFNFPPKVEGEEDHPADLRKHLIKRCIGIGGDVIEVRQQQVYVNGIKQSMPRNAQTSYLLKTNEILDERFFRKYNVVNDYQSAEGPFINWNPVEMYNVQTQKNELVGYQIQTTEATAQQLRRLDWVKAMEPLTAPAGEKESGIYGTSVYHWNRDNFGPLAVPKQGITIPINAKTIAVYGSVIERYEHLESVKVNPDQVEINGKKIQSYTFKQDYYFMMGDSRHNSDDSRYWGFVPADHIVGKAVFVWMSIDPVAAQVWNKIRWNRLFSVIN